jgi:predicted nucleic acid-binding protein
MSRVALDTNILVYLAGLGRSESDAPKIDQARQLVGQLSVSSTLVAPAQTLGELYVVALRAGLAPVEARALILEFSATFLSAPTGAGTALAAADLAVDHKLQFWDAVIVTAAAEAGCSILLSEDMQHSFVARGLTIVSPFADPPHPKLAALLR